MADNRGDYQQPSNPAPVSLPGSLSKRTDGGAIDGMTPAQVQADYSGFPYGTNKAIAEQQSAAPMAASAMPEIVPLHEFTRRPEEPITSGINSGPGVGREALNLPNQAPTLIDTVRHLAQFDPSGDAELILRQMIDNG